MKKKGREICRCLSDAGRAVASRASSDLGRVTVLLVQPCFRSKPDFALHPRQLPIFSRISEDFVFGLKDDPTHALYKYGCHAYFTVYYDE